MDRGGRADARDQLAGDRVGEGVAVADQGAALHARLPPGGVAGEHDPDQWRRHLEVILAGFEPSSKPLKEKPAPKGAAEVSRAAGPLEASVAAACPADASGVAAGPTEGSGTEGSGAATGVKVGAAGGTANSPVLAPWFTLSATSLAIAVIIYGFLSSVLPVWVFLAPRDYLSTKTG